MYSWLLSWVGGLFWGILQACILILILITVCLLVFKCLSKCYDRDIKKGSNVLTMQNVYAQLGTQEYFQSQVDRSLVWQTEPNTWNWDFSGKSRAQSCYTWNAWQLHNGHFSANSDPAILVHHISRRFLKCTCFLGLVFLYTKFFLPTLFVCLITSLLSLIFSVNHFLPGLPQRASRSCLLMDAMNGWKK